MLRLISEDRIKAVLDFCDGDAIATRVGAYLRAYRTEMDFAMFWEQMTDGKITSAVSKIDGDMTVCISGETDFDELSEFIRVIGFNTLFSQAETFRYLSLDCVHGDILKFIGESEKSETVALTVEPKTLYELTCRVNKTEMLDSKYLPWLSDFTFRQRRDMLRAVGIFKDDKLVSCAMTSAETADSAIISGVATDEAHRRQGFAKSCVMTLADILKTLNKESIFVMTETEVRTKYYENLGFVKTGEWARASV